MIFLSPKGIAWGGSEPWGHVPKKVEIFLLFPSLSCHEINRKNNLIKRGPKKSTNISTLFDVMHDIGEKN